MAGSISWRFAGGANLRPNLCPGTPLDNGFSLERVFSGIFRSFGPVPHKRHAKKRSFTEVGFWLLGSGNVRSGSVRRSEKHVRQGRWGCPKFVWNFPRGARILRRSSPNYFIVWPRFRSHHLWWSWGPFIQDRGFEIVVSFGCLGTVDSWTLRGRGGYSELLVGAPCRQDEVSFSSAPEDPVSQIFGV